MGLLGWFKTLRGQEPKTPAAQPVATTHDVGDEWEEVPAFVDTDPHEHPEVSVIATAIAAADRPESQFVVRRVQVVNPEWRRVALISTAIAAGALEKSDFVVRSISKKKTA